MALSRYFYVPGNPQYIHYKDRCWRRLTQQSLQGEKLTLGVDVEGYDNVNECLGVTNIFEIGEVGAFAIVEVTDGGVAGDPSDPAVMDVFRLGAVGSYIRVENETPSQTGFSVTGEITQVFKLGLIGMHVGSAKWSETIAESDIWSTHDPDYSVNSYAAGDTEDWNTTGPGASIRSFFLGLP